VQLLCLLGRGEARVVVGGQEPGLNFQNPVPADHGGHPVLSQRCFKTPFVKIGLAEGGKIRGLAPQIADELSLANDSFGGVPVFSFTDKFQTGLRFSPDVIEVE